MATSYIPHHVFGFWGWFVALLLGFGPRRLVIGGIGVRTFAQKACCTLVVLVLAQKRQNEEGNMQQEDKIEIVEHIPVIHDRMTGCKGSGSEWADV